MIEQLLVYQEADAKLRKIEKELYDCEDRKKAVMAKKVLDGVEDSLTNLDVKAAELVNEYEKAVEGQKKIKEQEEEFKKSLEGVADEIEAGYLLKKIDELMAKLKAITTKASKIADDIQSVLKEYKSIKESYKSAQVTFNESGKKYSELKASKAEEKAKIEKELSELAKSVDPALMERYKKKRDNKVYPVIYEVTTNVCGACNMELPMSELTSLKNGEVIECDHCGRLLYKK